MKRLIGLICILVGIFLMIGMLFKNENLFHLSFSREKPVTTASAKKEEIDQLDISLSGFRVKVKPENRSDISVTAVNGKGKMYAEQTGGTFKIRAENKSFLFFTQFEKGELLVKIPTDYHKNVKITGGSGVSEIDGEGKLSLQDVILKSTSGNLTAENFSAKNIEIKATSGRLAVSHIDAKDSDIGATSGRADINDVKGELQLGMTSGRLTASFDTIESPVSFHMTSGSAKFNLPDDGDFNVQVKKTSGSVDHSYDFDQVDSEGRGFTGTRGKGTHLVDIEMTSGNLKLR
ncbi:LiaG family protein [Bacillus safensis]|uniref:LiaG family protein n=1 Tax=Bacillus safensis TaxID=561879 RepID=UPI003D780B5B